jgi:hypothetical protein
LLVALDTLEMTKKMLDKSKFQRAAGKTAVTIRELRESI